MYFLRWLLFRRFRMAAELCHQAGKLLNHQRDQLSPEAISKLREAIANLRTAMHSSYNRATLEEKIAKLEETGSRKLIPYRSPGMRENVEVALFAVAIAMSVRTFFFQPMGIPTGSMQPTLYGITEGNLAQEESAPTGVNAWVQHYLAGVSYHHLVSDGNWQLISVDPPRKSFVLFNRQQLTFRDMDTGDKIVRDISPPMNSGNSMLSYGKASSRSLNEFILNPQSNYTYKNGDDIINMRRESGDHLLINRFTYNLRKPDRGEIIVFETKNIKPLKQNLFYIKRLVGLPNENIKIGDDRHLIINKKRYDASDHPFELVYSFDLAEKIPPPQDSRFSGHVNQRVFQQIFPTGSISPNFIDSSDEFKVPPNRYLAFGDNTLNSLDSRSWGSLPGKNIFGKASFIYWPFLGQKDRIRPNRFGWAFQ
jgi:signal peptidase I